MTPQPFYITITGFDHYYGKAPFDIEDLLILRKEPDNRIDSDAIQVQMPLLGCVGYVANSVRTTARGTMSAGRLYDKVPEECAAVVRFITERSIIAEVLPNKQLHVQTQITLMDCVKDHRPKTHDWLL